MAKPKAHQQVTIKTPPIPPWTAKRSWWLEVSREDMTAVARAEQDRMSASPHSVKVIE